MKQPLDKAALKRRRDGIFATLALLVVAALVFLGVRAQRSVTIKKGTTTIENGAYANKSMLRSVTIPDTVTGIGERAFSGCSELRSVEIPDSVTEIGDRAFEGCHDLSSVTLPDGVQVIQRYTFDGCSSLESIVSPTASPSSRQARFPAASGWPASPWAAASKRWKRTPSGAVRR